MGVDIQTVIHFGPSSDIDAYFCRAGRDGKDSEAILFLYPGCLVGHVSKAMKNYFASKERRRHELLTNFVGGIDMTTVSGLKHSCCDICTLRCECQTQLVVQSQQYVQDDDENKEAEPEAVRIVTQG